MGAAMTDRNEVEALLRAAYAARKRGDVEAILGVFAENAHFGLAGPRQASPVAMCGTGLEALRAQLTGLVQAFEWLDQEILSMIVEESRAAVHWRGRIRSAVTGDEVETEVVDIASVENGKIVSFVEFCDTGLAARLMEALERPRGPLVG
jgi:ketosteroid isomerase-like protein